MSRAFLIDGDQLYPIEEVVVIECEDTGLINIEFSPLGEDELQ